MNGWLADRYQVKDGISVFFIVILFADLHLQFFKGIKWNENQIPLGVWLSGNMIIMLPDNVHCVHYALCQSDYWLF